MVNTTAILRKLNVRLFNNIGSSASIENYNESSIDKWGDATKTYSAPVNVLFVPWSLNKDMEQQFNFGDLKKGEMDAAFPYDTNINIKDRVTFDGSVYLVKIKEKFPIKNQNLVFVVRLKEELSDA